MLSPAATDLMRGASAFKAARPTQTAGDRLQARAGVLVRVLAHLPVHQPLD